MYAYRERIPLFRKSGVKYDSDFVVLKGKGYTSPVRADLKEPRKKDVMKIIYFDQQCFGPSRRKLLKPILLDSDNLRYMHSEEERNLGYIIAKVFEKMIELGPWACARGRSDIAVDLVKDTFNRLKDSEVSTCIPKKETPVTSMLMESGFSESFEAARMFLEPSVAGNDIYLAESLERG
jgi:hypothetical protein